MDTSKEYLEMCKQAHDLHKEKYPLKKRDWILYYGNGKRIFGYIDKIIKTEKKNVVPSLNVTIIYPNNENSTQIEDVDYLFCCIYSQDQLQKMMYDKYPRCICIGLLLLFADYLAETTSPEDEKSTLEQLWLAFVMEEKYNKIWDGEDWTKE